MKKKLYTRSQVQKKKSYNHGDFKNNIITSRCGGVVYIPYGHGEKKQSFPELPEFKPKTILRKHNA